MNDKEIISILKKAILWILSLVVFLLPLLFLTNTTDPFSLPKQVFLVIAASLLLFLWAVLSIFQKKIVLRTNPFVLPLGIFTLIILLSSVLSRNMYDSLAVALPVIASFILFFVMINIVTEKKEFLMVLGALILGAVGTSIISILYYFQIYFLPVAAAQNKYFTTFGSPIQHILYIAPLLIVCLFSVLAGLKKQKIGKSYAELGFLIGGIVLLIGAGLILYQVLTVSQKPNLLPYTYGFQIATAAISQDQNRFLISLPLGSGYGTFLSDFTRFKFPSINNNPVLWNYPFTYSSSFALEILTTTGILGFLAYLFTIYRVLKTRSRYASPLFLGLITILILSFFLPFALSEVFLLYILIGVYASCLFIFQDKRTDTMKISLVALKEGLFSIEETDENARRTRSDSRALPVVVALIILVVAGYASFLAVQLLIADTKIAKSLSAANSSNGQAIYNLQREALAIFPYRSDYYRIFSQLNLGLANSISQGVPKGSKPSDQVQQTVSQLLQQAVANARTAVALAPVNAVNWDNLGQIYRSLIGVGQNADQFAIATLNQAILLDPSNPLLRLELGGVYYQLQQYDAAQNQFQIAIQLKPDLANAYYNLGHALESKGDLQSALTAYNTALDLVQANQNDRKALSAEIDALKAKIQQGGNANTQKQTNTTGSATNQPPLGLTAPSVTTAPSKNQVKVPPPPTGAATPTPSEAVTPTP